MARSRNRPGKRGGKKHRERVAKARARDALLRVMATDFAPVPTLDIQPRPNLSALRQRMALLARKAS